MKTSNKLFLAAIALLLISLVAYNSALSAQYRTGNYKKPFFGYTALPLTGFSEVAVPVSSRFRVNVVRGPYAVHVNEDAAKYVHITQQGQRLTIALAFPKEEEELGSGETVVISCPRLQQLVMSGGYTVAGKPKYGTLGGGNVTIVGLRQDSLLLVPTRGTSVQLTDNVLGQLRAVLSSGSQLYLVKNNRIQAANLNVGGDCSLEQQCGIPQPRYQFSTTATARFEGPAARGLSAPEAQ